MKSGEGYEVSQVTNPTYPNTSYKVIEKNSEEIITTTSAKETTTSYISTTTAKKISTTTTQATTTTVKATTIAPTTTMEIVETKPAQEVSSGLDPFLECVKHRESRGDYTAINSSSGAAGAYQFMPVTWVNTAKYAGRNDLIDIHPSAASPSDQDYMAITLYQWQGKNPWKGNGC